MELLASELAPASLLEQCITSLLTHQSIWLTQSSGGLYEEELEPKFTFRHDLSLPESVCNHLLRLILRKELSLVDVFRDLERTRLTEVDLRKTPLPFGKFEMLMRHRPERIWFGDSPFQPSSSSLLADVVLNNLDNCFVLCLGCHLSDVLNHSYKDYRKCCHVRYLSGHITQHPDVWLTNMRHFRNLQVFELLDSSLDVCQLKTLADMFGDKLTALSLRGCRGPLRESKAMIEALCNFRRLESLDIAMPTSRAISSSCVQFENPEESLVKLLHHMPYLRCLDISCTNLDKAIVSPDGWNRVLNDKTRTFDYLGLVFTDNDAASYGHHPAHFVLGDANTRQIANTFRFWARHGAHLVPFLATAHRYFRDFLHTQKSDCDALFDCLVYLGDILELHRDLHEVMFSATCCCFYLVKETRPELPPSLLWRVLTDMACCLSDDSLSWSTWRNCALTIIQLISEGVSQGHRLAAEATLRRIKKFIGSPINAMESLSTLACTLNTMTCISHEFKQVLGDLGAVSVGAHLISMLLDQMHSPQFANLHIDEYVHTLETAWTILWNLTDETHLNSYRFVEEEKGLVLFLRTMERCYDNPTVTRNVLGAVGNVAEVTGLRHHLREKEVLGKLIAVLSYGDLEVEYNASGILCHIFTDGWKKWEEAQPIVRSHERSMRVSYERAQQLVCMQVFTWDLAAERGINYTSFKPIIALLDYPESLACTAWTCWALCNMTGVYPDRYNPMLARELDLEKLLKVVNNEALDSRTRNLARQLFERVLSHKDKESPPEGLPEQACVGAMEADESAEEELEGEEAEDVDLSS